MKLQTLLLSVIILMFLYGCSVNKTITEPNSSRIFLSEEEIKARNQEVLILSSHLIAEEYLAYINDEQVTVELGYFGWLEVEKYWSVVSELDSVRKEFEIANQFFLDFINSKDEGIKTAIENSKERGRGMSKEEWSNTKSVVYGRVQREYPEAYHKFLNIRQDKLRICNYKTLEYIVKDYDQKGKIFPIDWIPDSHMKIIINEEFIQKLNAGLEGVSHEKVGIYKSWK